MTLLLADAHAHLDEPALRDRKEAVLRRARQAGVGLVVNVGVGLENCREQQLIIMPVEK